MKKIKNKVEVTPTKNQVGEQISRPCLGTQLKEFLSDEPVFSSIWPNPSNKHPLTKLVCKFSMERTEILKSAYNPDSMEHKIPEFK